MEVSSPLLSLLQEEDEIISRRVLVPLVFGCGSALATNHGITF